MRLGYTCARSLICLSVPTSVFFRIVIKIKRHKDRNKTQNNMPNKYERPCVTCTALAVVRRCGDALHTTK